MAAVVVAAIIPSSSSVQIERDDNGVWFINGPETASTYDIFKAMGYAVSTDRLYQMELFRRSGTGRMSEIFGEDYVVSDKFIRTLGYSGGCIYLFLSSGIPVCVCAWERQFH